MSAEITKGTAFEDGGVVNMARIRNWSGTNITQASTTSISYSVFDLSTGSTIIDASALTVSAVVFDSLQTPDIWTEAIDDIGYNFRHDALATTLPNGDRTYKFEYKITPASGQVFWVVFEITALAIRTS